MRFQQITLDTRENGEHKGSKSEVTKSQEQVP